MSQTRSKNVAQRHGMKTLLSVGGITLAAGGLALGVAAPANATATTTQVQTGWACPSGGFYQSSIYGLSDKCVYIDGQGYWVIIGPASPVYSTVTTYTASFDSPGTGSTVTTATPKLTGTAKPGDTITIKDSSGKTLGTTVADGNGNWSFTPSSPLPNGSTTLTATQSSDGNTASRTFTVAVPVTLASPAAGSTITTATPTVTGTAHPGDTVTVKNGAGQTLGTATANSSGNWSLTLATPLPNGSNTLTATQSSNGGTASSTFTVNAPTPPPASAPVTITSPTTGSAYPNDGKSPFTGTGQPGATITVKDASGNPVCTTTVDGTGTWSCQPDSGALTPADGSKITVQQDDKGTITTATVVLDVAEPLDGPIVEPGGLALAGGVLLAAAGAEGVRRRRRHITQA